MWGDSTVSWESVPSVQAAGGLLCLWNNSVFHVERSIKGNRFLCLEGKWKSEDQRLFIVNVYAPCDLAGKRNLWEELLQLKESNLDGAWCFLGDFNSIRNQEERIGCFIWSLWLNVIKKMDKIIRTKIAKLLCSLCLCLLLFHPFFALNWYWSIGLNLLASSLSLFRWFCSLSAHLLIYLDQFLSSFLYENSMVLLLIFLL